MPDLLDPQVDAQELQRFFLANWEVALVVGIVLVFVWFATPRLVSPVLRRLLRASAGEFEEGGVTAVELAKRTRTIESLTVAMIRIGILAALTIITIGVLDVWGLLAGLGLLLAALTLAGQPIVLDFLMGLAIVIEGTYFHGDNIAVGDPKWRMFGTVESVGLRHTVIRGPDGTVHSISNRNMSQVSNRTHMFAGADVTVVGIRESDFDRVLGVMDRVGKEVAQDPAFAGLVMEPLQVKYVGDPDDLGWSATMRGQVLAGERWAVATEVRKRLVRAFADEDIQFNRRVIAPRPGPPGHYAPGPAMAVDGDD